MDFEDDKPAAEAAAAELGLTLLEPLREGPSTRTWSARTRDDQNVALVLLGRATADDRERFRRMAQDLMSAADAFPQLLHVREISSTGDALVTDVGGLSSARDAYALAAEQRTDLARRLVSALASLHAGGFVHGALTPEAVLVDESWRPVLGDLGTISRDEPFAAPEVVRGELPTPRSDVYSAGKILLELLGDDASPALAEVVSKAVSPLSLSRHADGVDLSRAVNAALNGAGLASEAPPAPLPVSRRADLVSARPSKPPRTRAAGSRSSRPRSGGSRITRTHVLVGVLGVLVVLGVLEFLLMRPHSDGTTAPVDIKAPN